MPDRSKDTTRCRAPNSQGKYSINTLTWKPHWCEQMVDRTVVYSVAKYVTNAKTSHNICVPPDKCEVRLTPILETPFVAHLRREGPMRKSFGTSRLRTTPLFAGRNPVYWETNLTVCQVKLTLSPVGGIPGNCGVDKVLVTI